jgi:MFS family permease
MLEIGTNMKNEDFGFTLMFITGAAICILGIIPSAIVAPDKKSKEYLAGAGAWYRNIVSVSALGPSIVLLLTMISYAVINTYIFEFTVEQGITGASTFYIIFAASLAFSRPLSGYLAGKFGINRVLYPALAIFAGSMIMIGISKTTAALLIAAVISAIGYGAAQPSIQAMCMQSELTVKSGVASNTMYMGIDMGLFLGPFLGGFVYARADYSFMFSTAAIPPILAMIGIIFVYPMHKRRLKKLESQDM